MVSIVPSTRPPPPEAQPAWDIARLFPPQGYWDERDYLALDTNHLVEFTDGYIRVLPMPDMAHQLIVGFLVDELKAHARPNNLGRTLFAPFRVRIRDNKFREPDVTFMLSEHADRMGQKFWDGADLVMEVVSPDPGSRERDHEEKRADYAEAGIPEYWIIDPQEATVTILQLQDGRYVPRGTFKSGDVAASASLAGFKVDVAKLWEAAAG